MIARASRSCPFVRALAPSGARLRQRGHGGRQNPAVARRAAADRAFAPSRRQRARWREKRSVGNALHARVAAPEQVNQHRHARRRRARATPTDSARSSGSPRAVASIAASADRDAAGSRAARSPARVSVGSARSRRRRAGLARGSARETRQRGAIRERSPRCRSRAARPTPDPRARLSLYG